MNYSTLLPRSIDFDPFLALLKQSYLDQSRYTLDGRDESRSRGTAVSPTVTHNT